MTTEKSTPTADTKMCGFFLFSLLLATSLTVTLSNEYDLASFKRDVINDERVWLVYFYSAMCGSCREFSGVWGKVDASMKSIVTAKINIDEKGGMEIAKELNVLVEGIPNVRLLNSQSDELGVTIVASKS